MELLRCSRYNPDETIKDNRRWFKLDPILSLSHHLVHFTGAPVSSDYSQKPKEAIKKKTVNKLWTFPKWLFLSTTFCVFSFCSLCPVPLSPVHLRACLLSASHVPPTQTAIPVSVFSVCAYLETLLIFLAVSDRVRRPAIRCDLFPVVRPALLLADQPAQCPAVAEVCCAPAHAATMTNSAQPVCDAQAAPRSVMTGGLDRFAPADVQRGVPAARMFPPLVRCPSPRLRLTIVRLARRPKNVVRTTVRSVFVVPRRSRLDAHSRNAVNVIRTASVSQENAGVKFVPMVTSKALLDVVTLHRVARVPRMTCALHWNAVSEFVSKVAMARRSHVRFSCSWHLLKCLMENLGI